MVSPLRQTRVCRWRRAVRAALLALHVVALVARPSAVTAQAPVATVPERAPAVPLIVVLHSYDSSYDWTRQISQGLRDQLGYEDSRVDIREEFLDGRRNTQPDHLARVKQLLEGKYASLRPALVITSDNIATRFVRDNPALFGGAPVVFGGVDDPELIASLPRDRFTGVTEWFHLERVVALVERLRPAMRRIYIVTDAKPAGESWRRYFAAVQVRTRVQFVSLAGSQLTLREVLEALARDSRPEDLVLTSNFSEDRSGATFLSEATTRAIVAATQAPVIGLGMGRLRPGLLGIANNSGLSHGRFMGRKAQALLAGRSPAQVPVEVDPAVQLVLDWNELGHHGVDVGALTSDVEVVNRPTTFYAANKRLLWATSAFMVLQSIVIGGLILNVRRRRRAEQELRTANEALRREQGVRREAEDQLRHAQKMEAVGRLAGGVAHDFNNLLTVITGYCALLLARVSPSSPDHEALDQIRRASDQAAMLTQNLLAFGRRQFAAPVQVDMARAIRDITPMLTRVCDVRVALDLDLAPDTGVVWLPQGQLEQVVINLAINARDAMPDGGRLRIASRPGLREGGATSNHATRETRHAVLTVSDTGTGMDEATRTRIFEPFFTTKPVGRGTGLGLATVYAIVTQAGGVVTVDSSPGAGTTFEISLPHAGAEPQNSSVA
jgi:signal transduction histidine kinase